MPGFSFAPPPQFQNSPTGVGFFDLNGQQRGTSNVSFQAQIAADSGTDCGAYQTITTMPYYSGKSIEELRFEDYQMDTLRLGRTALSSGGATTTSSTFSNFGLNAVSGAIQQHPTNQDLITASNVFNSGSPSLHNSPSRTFNPSTQPFSFGGGPMASTSPNLPFTFNNSPLPAITQSSFKFPPCTQKQNNLPLFNSNHGTVPLPAFGCTTFSSPTAFGNAGFFGGGFGGTTQTNNKEQTLGKFETLSSGSGKSGPPIENSGCTASTCLFTPFSFGGRNCPERNSSSANTGLFQVPSQNTFGYSSQQQQSVTSSVSHSTPLPFGLFGATPGNVQSQTTPSPLGLFRATPGNVQSQTTPSPLGLFGATSGNVQSQTTPTPLGLFGATPGNVESQTTATPLGFFGATPEYVQSQTTRSLYALHRTSPGNVPSQATPSIFQVKPVTPSKIGFATADSSPAFASSFGVGNCSVNNSFETNAENPVYLLASENTGAGIQSASEHQPLVSSASTVTESIQSENQPMTLASVEALLEANQLKMLAEIERMRAQVKELTDQQERDRERVKDATELQRLCQRITDLEARWTDFAILLAGRALLGGGDGTSAALPEPGHDKVD